MGQSGNTSSGFMMFPSEEMQALSCLIYLLGVSILAHCLSRRLSAETWSWGAIKEMSWARLCALLVFFDSWLFLFTSGILVFGVGLESKEIVCALGIYLCVLFYATSKLLIYSFLAEKVFLVWTPTVTGARRWKSPVYIACMIMIAIYGIVIATMVAGKIHYLRESDGVCIIGLQRYSSLTLLSYDLFVNIVLTLLFLWPIFRSRLANPRLRNVAIRTLVASAVALTTSTINMLILALLRGHERGWICLGSCGADVIFNALTIFWVTKNRDSTQRISTSTNDGNTRRHHRCPSEIKTFGHPNNLVLSFPPPTPSSRPQSFPSPDTTSVLQSPPPSFSSHESTTPFSLERAPELEDLEMQNTRKPSVIDSVSVHGVQATVSIKTVTDDTDESVYCGSDEDSL